MTERFGWAHYGKTSAADTLASPLASSDDPPEDPQAKARWWALTAPKTGIVPKIEFDN